jgi:hypothetical protein
VGRPEPDAAVGLQEGKRGTTSATTPADSGGQWWETLPELDTQSQIVYVTRTGHKYQRDGCQDLRRSRIPMALGEARKMYGPCSVCRPAGSP